MIMATSVRILRQVAIFIDTDGGLIDNYLKKLFRKGDFDTLILMRSERSG